MIHILVHFFSFLTLGVVLWSSGRVLVSLLDDLGSWRHLASFCLGFSWWIPSLFVLATVGLLNHWGIGLAALPLLVLAVARREYLSPWKSSEFGHTEPGYTIGERLLATLFGLVLLAKFLLALTPQISWDANVYHLTLPRLYLENEGFRDIELNVYSQWPLGAQLFYAAAMLVGDYMLAKTVHFGFGLLTIYGLLLAFSQEKNGSRRSRRLGGWLAATFFLANGIVAWEMDRAYVDLAQSFFLLCTFLFLHRGLEESKTSRGSSFLLLAGLCGGLLASVKVTGILSVVVVTTICIPQLVAIGPRAIRPLLTRFALPVTLLWMPWLVKTAWSTGNPIYPFFHRALGGPDWSSDLARRFATWQGAIGMGRDPFDYLLLPIRVILQGEWGYDHFDGELSDFWIVLIPLAIALGRRHLLGRRALGVAALAFVFWALSSQQMRFLVPTLPLLAIATAGMIPTHFHLLPRLGRRDGFLLAMAGALVLSVYIPTVVNGFRTAKALVRFEGDLEASVVPAHHRFINENLPADARLLFINTNRGFFCRRDYIADSFFEASQIADWLGDARTVEEVRGLVQQRHITHLLASSKPRVDNFPSALADLMTDPEQVEVLFVSSNREFFVLRLRDLQSGQTYGSNAAPPAGGSGSST